MQSETRLISDDSARIWKTNIATDTFPFLKEHQVDGEAVFPATAHLETAFAVGKQAFPGSDIALRDVHFESALIFQEGGRFPHDVRLEVTSNEGDYHLCSRPLDADSDTPWSKHSSGRITFLPESHPEDYPEFQVVQERFRTVQHMDVAAFYETIRKAGLYYGPHFQCVASLQQTGREILGRLRLPDNLRYEAQQFFAHPALLDACLHTVFSDVHRRGDPEKIYLPYSIERVRFHHRLPEEVISYIQVKRNDETYLCYDLFVFDTSGTLLIEVRDITCKVIGGAHGDARKALYDGCYEYHWQAGTTSANDLNDNHDLKHCLIITPADSALDTLRKAFEERGLVTDVLQGSHGNENMLVKALGTRSLDRRTLIVYFCEPGTGSTLNDWSQVETVPTDTHTLLHLFQTLIQQQAHPRLALVTTGASAASAADEGLNPGQGVLIGMMRVFRNECPAIPSRCVDLPLQPTAMDIRSLVNELCRIRHDRDEFEVALRGSQRLLRVMQAVRPEQEEEACVDLPGTGGNYRAAVREPGMLDSVAFRQSPEPVPAEDELVLEVLSAALNFKDVVNAMGVLPDKAVKGGLSADQLGLEVCGIVSALGNPDSPCRLGEKVIARVSHGFAGKVIAREDCITSLPANLTPQQGAAISVTFLTAYYGLYSLARVQKGETVLIHSAAGGVGHAAIQLARLAGTRVIATAGTREKRQALQDIGIENVFDSRSLDFHEKVMAVTDGRGVDVVLNALTGNFITQSIKSLAPFGRFIEIGKADIYKNAKLSMERLGENISFHVVDVDRMAVQRPELHKQLLDDVVNLFAAGKLQPPPITVFPIARLAEAMKFMSRAAYVGKIVVVMEGNTVRALPPLHAEVSKSASYFISGGTAGFGLSLAEWLVSKGARHLVLASRSGVKNEQDRRRIDELVQQGVTVCIEKLDVTDSHAVNEMFAGFGSHWPGLAGVIHAAGVLDDATIENMTDAQFRQVFVPKAVGAWNLHRATVVHKLTPKLFVTLSSISSVMGLYGQVKYAAANYTLDTLVELRRQQGLSGISINLGVLGDYAGMSNTENDQADIIGLLESHGISPMPLPDVLGKFNLAVAHNPRQRLIARFDLNRFSVVYPHLQRDMRFADAIRESREDSLDGKQGNSLASQLQGLDEETRVERLSLALKKALGRILDTSPEKIDAATSIDKLSLDSLMLNQLRNWILRNLDLSYPLIKLLKGPSVDDISQALLQELNNDSGQNQNGGGGVSTESTFSLFDDERIPPPWQMVDSRTRRC